MPPEKEKKRKKVVTINGRRPLASQQHLVVSLERRNRHKFHRFHDGRMFSVELVELRRGGRQLLAARREQKERLQLACLVSVPMLSL